MGKPTRNELLAKYYLRAAGVAAVWIDATGHVGARDVEIETDRIRLLPHAIAVDRALAAVAAVNNTINKMGSTGELKAFNRAFKEARRVDPTIRYFDYPIACQTGRAAPMQISTAKIRRTTFRASVICNAPQLVQGLKDLSGLIDAPHFVQCNGILDYCRPMLSAV
jgi:hypothetical protein